MGKKVKLVLVEDEETTPQTKQTNKQTNKQKGNI